MKKKFALALLLSAALTGGAWAESTLPVSFDMRTDGDGGVPPIRDQMSWGTCWAFATIAGCETNYLLQVGKDQTDPFLEGAGTSTIDLSEMHLAWFTYMAPQRHQRFSTYVTKNGRSVRIDNPTPSQAIQGGWDYKSIAVLSRGVGWGPVFEKDCPYIDEKCGTPAIMEEKGWSWSANREEINAERKKRTNEWAEKNIVGRKPSGYKTVLRLTDASYLNHPQRSLLFREHPDTVKRLIMERGAVFICFYSAKDPRFYGSGAYIYTDKTLSNREEDRNTRRDPRRNINHCVAIVGWDDNYPVEKFTGPEQPDQPGAWLIRNSWGEDANRHKEGYFWMSYEQHIECGSTFTMAEPDPNMKAYIHDDLGGCDAWGDEDGGSSRAANVFQVRSAGEALTEIGFYTTGLDATAGFEVYGYGAKHPGERITDGTLLASVSEQKFPLSGYHTVKLSSPVDLVSGDYFAVLMTAANPDGSDPVAVEKRIKFSSDYARIGDGESYFLQEGKWVDGAFHAEKLPDSEQSVVTPMNACVRAFVTDSVKDKPLPDRFDDDEEDDEEDEEEEDRDVDKDKDKDKDKNQENREISDDVTITGVKVETYPTVTVSTDAGEIPAVRQVTVTLVSNDGTPLPEGMSADVYFVLVDEDWDDDAETEVAVAARTPAALAGGEEEDDYAFDEFLQDEEYYQEVSFDVDPFYTLGFRPDRFFLAKDGMVYPVYGPFPVTTGEGGSVTLDADALNLPEGYYNVLYTTGTVTGDLPVVHFMEGGTPVEDEEDVYWFDDGNSSTRSQKSHSGCDTGFGAARLLALALLARREVTRRRPS